MHLPPSLYSLDPLALGTHSFHHLSWASEAFVSVGFEVGPINSDYYTLLFFDILRYSIDTALIFFDIFLLLVESIKTLTDTLLLHPEHCCDELVTGPHWPRCAGGVHSAEHGGRGGRGTGHIMIAPTSTKHNTYLLLLIASAIMSKESSRTNGTANDKGEIISLSYLCVRSQISKTFTTNDILVMLAARVTRTYRLISITVYVHSYQTHPGNPEDLEPTDSELAAMEEDSESVDSTTATVTEEGAMTPDRPLLHPNGGLLSTSAPSEGECDKSSLRSLRHDMTSSLAIVTEQERKRRDSDSSERRERRKDERQGRLNAKRGLCSVTRPDPQPDVIAEPSPSPLAAPKHLAGSEFDPPSAPGKMAEAPESMPETRPTPHHITNGEGTLDEDKGLGAESQIVEGRGPPSTNKQSAGPDGAMTKNQKRKLRKKHHDKIKKQKLVGGREEEAKVVDDSLGPEDVFKKGDAVITLKITQQGRGSDAISDVARLLFLVSDQFTVTSMYTIPDGARIEVPDRESAAVVQNALVEAGWTVEASDVWARYVLTVPALLAGSGPDSTGLDPATLVRGLMLRNAGHGLPAGSIRYMSHAWETVQVEGVAGPSSGSTRQRMRIWVDVSPEGEAFLRGHAFLLETLVSAVRLRRAPRSRHHQAKSSDEPGDD